MRSECASDLLDAIIRQDKLKLCEVNSRLFMHPDVEVWAFHRWERASREFKLIYPNFRTIIPFPADLLPVLENRRSVVDRNVSRSYGEWVETRHYPVTLILPLQYNSQLVGLVQGFSSCDLETCRRVPRTLGTRIRILAQCWELINILEEKERIAFTDSLTGLFNSKFLLHFLKAELARCTRYRKPVAVIFLDLDYFKNVNDAYGHLVGSAVLAEVGKVIRSNVREADTASRYGGDEYVVVLTETGPEEALIIAERLRNTVASHCFGQRKGLAIKLTISAGVAVFPDHGRTAEELIHRADTAMYEAKRDKRNCVKVAV
ncbi:MAG TPA: GGDEF domain-containing protein [Acidobacteriota bacterium]|nr:GGDEF domain-containing protein [Acidobacteriota bacterium]